MFVFNRLERGLGMGGGDLSYPGPHQTSYRLMKWDVTDAKAQPKVLIEDTVEEVLSLSENSHCWNDCL